MKTQNLTQRADTRRILHIAVLFTLVLAAAALVAPARADAAIVVRARIGDVDVAYRDGGRCEQARLEVRPATLAPVARRVLVSQTVKAGCCDREPVVGQRCGNGRQGGLVWVPGHWEMKRQVRNGRGHGHGGDHHRNHGKLVKVWVAGHWCQR